MFNNYPFTVFIRKDRFAYVYACNFLALLAQPASSNPLQCKLYLTVEGEERTRFSFYIQPSVTSPNSPCQTSPSLDFATLPAEIQLHILSFCSGPTLLQLMRVSSFLRKEASKLFWAHPDAYFAIEASWLLKGGHTGYTLDDLGFLANVQNVQIDFDRGLDNTICPMKSGREIEARQDSIASFWAVLQAVCPRVKRVVINPSLMHPSKGIETHSVPQAMQVLVRASPPGIMTCALVSEPADEPVDIPSPDIDAIYASFPKRQRALYQPRPDDSWEKKKFHQNWKVVFAPTKTFSGPIGRIYKCSYNMLRLSLERHGLWFTMVVFLYRRFSNSDKGETFPCTNQNCNVSFQSAGECALHEAVMHNVPKDHQDWNQVEAYNWLPDEIKAEFEQHATTLMNKDNKNNELRRKIREEWNHSSHEQQREIRRSWLQQLENDPLWETEAEDRMESRIWKELRMAFPYDGETRCPVICARRFEKTWC